MNAASLGRSARRSGAAAQAAVLIALAAASCAASALDEGRTTYGVRYASGGVSESEQLAMQVRRPGFNLWIVTAAIKSGDYLSDVRIKVISARDQVVFDAPLDGPWLMVDLPLGRYVIEALYAGETQRKVTTIHDGDHHQAIFHFKVDEAVAP